MRDSLIRGVLWLVLAAIFLACAVQAQEPDIRRDASVIAVERVMPSVVNIATETIIEVRDPFQELFGRFFAPYQRQTPNSSVSLGSGVIIDPEGYVLTNNHVVQRASKIWVKCYTNDTPYEADLIASNPRSDVALIKLRAQPGERFTAVRFAKDDDLLLGETVLALGNPFGLGGSVSRGILSSKSRVTPKESDQLEWRNWLQTDASINPGNSGGPLVNLRGELIGLNVAILSEAQGIGFAIPIKQVSQALSGIFTPETSGKQLWFGALVRVGPAPLVVTSVQANSPADKAGLKPGDRIAEINSQIPTGFIDFNELLVKNPDADDSLLVENDGQQRTVTVRLVPEKSFFNADLIEQLLGLRLQEITPDTAASYGVNPTDGFLVAGVDRSVDGAKQLEPGYLVTAIDGQTLPDLMSAAKALYAKKQGDTVLVNVLVEQRRGSFITVRRGSVEIPIRQP